MIQSTCLQTNFFKKKNQFFSWLSKNKNCCPKSIAERPKIVCLKTRLNKEKVLVWRYICLLFWSTGEIKKTRQLSYIKMQSNFSRLFIETHAVIHMLYPSATQFRQVNYQNMPQRGKSYFQMTAFKRKQFAI